MKYLYKYQFCLYPFHAALTGTTKDESRRRFFEEAADQEIFVF